MGHPVGGRCPVCGEPMEVTTLHCQQCDTIVSGHFTLGGFSRLTAEQLAFAETFIRCEGKITRVEEELGISYPTVRSRLTELIAALDYPLSEDSEQESTSDQRMEILRSLSRGQLTSEEAVSRLEAS